MATTTIMATTPVPGPQTGQRLLTVADLTALPSDLPSGTVLYELDNGRLIIMPPRGDIHGAVESKFTGVFLYEGEKRGHGKVRCGDVAIVLWRNPDRVVGADVAFITNASLPIRLSPEGYLETIPELIVEVKSKNDTLPEVERKVADYFRAGVKVVLVPDPAKKTVTVYRPGQTAQVFTEKDVLTVEDIIPSFKMLVADAFAKLPAVVVGTLTLGDFTKKGLPTNHHDPLDFFRLEVEIEHFKIGPHVAGVGGAG
jgi:Uma2 family endonuclease